MWMERLGRKVLFGILQPRKALKSLMKPRKFSGTDQKCTNSSIHNINWSFKKWKIPGISAWLAQWSYLLYRQQKNLYKCKCLY